MRVGGIFLLLLCALRAMAATPEEQIMQADREFNQATQANRAAGWMAYFAENAAVPANPPLAGKAALTEHYEKVFADPDFTLIWEPQKAEVFPGGQMGYTVGRYRARYRDAGKMMEQTGRYITVWKKQSDSTWKIVTDTGSEDGPAHLAK